MKQILLLALLVLGGNVAWGQNTTWNISTNQTQTYTLTTTTGNKFKVNNGTTVYDYLGNVTANAGADITIIFNNTNTILSSGQFNVSGNGGSITLQLGSNCTACTPSKPTLKTSAARGTAWFLMANYNTDPTNKSITILGKNPETLTTDGPESFTETSSHWNENFVLDGGAAKMEVIGDSLNRKVKLATGGIIHTFTSDGGGQPFRMQQGTLTLTKVTLQNYATSGKNGNHPSSAGIQIMTQTTINAGVRLALTQCRFTKLAASSGYCAVRMQGTKGGLIKSNYVNIDHCLFDSCYCLSGDATTNTGGTSISQNGVVRTLSNFRTPVEVTNCKMEHNLGPSIRHHEPYDMLIKNNIVQNNWNGGVGGGMQLRGPATLIGCKVRRNTATGDGGGIFYGTFIDATEMDPGHSILTMDENSEISGNKSYGNGGGIMLCGEQIHPGGSSNSNVAYYAFDPEGGLLNPLEPIRVEFVLNGGTIKDNRCSGQGGGVCITRHKNCTFYGTNCYLYQGTIENNKTWSNNGGTGKGGGVALITSNDYDTLSITTDVWPTDLNVDINEIKPQDIKVVIGEINGDKEIKIQNNSGSDGGGIYVNAHPVTYTHNNATSKVSTTVYDYSTIDNNSASGSGGGLYLANGSVTITNESRVGAYSPTLQKNKATSGSGGGIYLGNGDINMEGAIIGGSTETLGNSAGDSGGGIYVYSGSATMLSTTIQYNKAENGSGGGMYLGGGNVSINPNEIGMGIRSSISNNTAGQHGGGVYTGNGKLIAYGSFSESGTQSNHIEITNNKALEGNGGGIFCQGTSNSQSWEYDIRLRRVTIGNNEAGGSGGGIYLQKGKVSVIDGAINGNTATVNGGGVYTEEGNIDINATRDEHFASEIMGNTAGINGGGLNTHKGYIRIFGTNKDQRIPVANNVATTGSGGGIFCMGEGADNQYITMQHSDLINNKAVKGGGNAGTNVTAGSGGGMYLQKGKIAITDVNLQNNYAKNNGGGINNHEGSIDVDGCFIGSSHSDGGSYYCDTTLTYNPESPSNTDRGNKAGNNGGGIYTHKGDIDIEDYVETSGNIFREESKITFNEAGKNGGGINTHMGTIYINSKEKDDQIEVCFNKAERGGGMYANAGTIIVYNTLIHDNTATLHGGGANNHSGDIVIYGGSLSNNAAEKGHGGGAYTNVGDIDLFQFPSTELQNATLNHGTKVFNNIAKLNGGAFNNHTGRIDIRHATIYNNTATLGNGGAIFCEGPHANADKGLGYTIRLLCSDMVQNKTRGQDGTATDPTGRGGGIYLKYGSIYAHYSNIVGNEANINGGGMDNHSGDILLYGCDVRGNRAVEGHGGGIFTYSGDITTGPSTARDGLFNTSKYTIISNNTADLNGGGINNQQGNITINGDVVANNTSTQGNGGGIYITDGIINMKGGRIDNNKATHTDNGKGGGVYSGGGEFNIMERDANPTPIVLIVDSQVKRVTDGQRGVVHYHLVDQGKYSDVTNVEHGIVWGENSPSIEVVYGSAAGTTNGYAYEQGEPACQRITIPAKTTEQTSIGIEANKTYKVKAFFRYKTIENGTPVIKTGYSQTMEFVTYSNTEPLVHSGTVSNITSTSAEGSGRVMDDGGSSITQRGVEIWQVDDEGNMIGNAQRKPSTDETEFFTVNLTGLQPDKTYKARAYATNSTGTGFGNTVEFKTLKNTPDMGNNQVIVTTGIVNGEIVATAEFSMPTGTTFGGTNGVKAFGFVWSTDDDPELLQDHTVQCTQSSMTNDTTFTASYSPVRPNLTFYVRAYASYIETSVTPTSDITNYSVSEATQHISPSLDGSPVVRANSISGITQNGANIHGQLHYEGSSAVTEYGVVYSPNIQEPAIPTGTATDPKKVSVSGSPGTTEEFTVPISGLTPGTTYYLRVYAVNAADTAYSNNFNFTALPISQPNVVIISITDIDKVSAKVNFTINNGGGNIGGKGVNYSLNSDMSGATAVNSDAITYDETTGVYTASLLGLQAHKTYYVQAYATNSAGTHTCQTVSFKTDFDKPSVVLNSLTNLTSIATPLTSDGVYTVTPYLASGESAVDQSDYVKTYGICWSTLHNPTRNNSDVANTHFQDGTGGDITVVTDPQPQQTTSMTQRFPNTRYWARAYASTATPNDNTTDPNPENHTYSLADIVYSAERAFLTKPLMQSTGASNVTSTSATLAGNIASRDPEHYLVKYGVCWSETNSEAALTPNYGNSPANYVETRITSASSTTRSFSFNITGLTASDPAAANPQTYYYRAYAVNRNGRTGTGYDYTITQDSIAYGPVVEFVTKHYTITAVALPAVAGTVTGGGGYNSGDQCTLTASEPTSTDYAFQGWYLNDVQKSTTLQYTFNVTENANYQARYTSKVTITAGEHGKVSFTDEGWNVLAEQNTDNAMYDYNGSCTVYAKASAGYTFVNWTDADGNEVSTSANYTFTVTNVTNLTANFGTTRTITVSSADANQGTASGGGSFGEGASCTVTAADISPYAFIYWKEGDEVVSYDVAYTFTVDEDRDLVAHFNTTNTISVSSYDASQGTATVNGESSANIGNGGLCTVIATPAEGYVFLNWTESGTVVSTYATYSFIVSGDRTLVANFGRTIAVSANNNGSVSGGGNYPVGAECTVTATPAEGYVFLNWTENNVVVVDGENNPVPATYTFTVSGNRTLVANFTSRGRGASRPSRPRDIYPAPAREPWDWDDDFRDGEQTVPTVTTGAVTFSVDMQVINAIVSGNIVTELGAEEEDATLVEAGIWYSTINGTYDATNNLGTFVAATSPVVGEAYSVAFPELTIGQTYYARAYAKNNKVNDYGFGEAITIVFNSPSVATLSALSFVGESRKAILKGKVTNAGSTGLTQVGVWYSTSSEPYDATSNQGTFIEVSPRPTVNTVYSATIDDGLSGGETYYVRAYATNNNGVTYSFGDPIQLFNPTVATGAVSDQTPTSATVAGSVTGSAEGAEAGVWYSFTGNEYDEDANPGIFKQATIGAGGTISVELTGLLADQTYYIRAYASNDNKASISFGDAKTYKFSNPKVETVGVSNLPEAGVTVSGKVTENGSLPEDLSGVTAGVWYSTKGGDYNPQMNKGYFVSGPSNPDLNLNTEYSVDLPGTGCPAWGSDSTYHARAYLNIGTDESPNYVFGNSIRFSKDNVVLVTGDITNVTGNSATVKGTVVSLGKYATEGYTVEAGIWWSKDGPTYDASSNAGTFVKKSPYTVGTEYTVELTDLQGYNQYVRAYAQVTTSGKADTYFFGNLTSMYTNSPSVSNNDAVYGGGIFVDYNQTNPARIMFAGGSNTETAGRINENHASEAGGGIYISEDASLYMKYYCEVNDNHVNEGKKGGGVYLNGILKVGENPGDQNKHSLKIDHNWAGNENGWEYDPSLPNKNNRSNVYLPTDPKPLPTNENWDQLNTGDKQRVITLLSDISATYVEGGETKYYTKIGLSVDHGFRAVIYTKLLGDENSTATEAVTHEAWLSTLVPNQGGSLNSAIFDDANMYYALHVHNTTNPDDLRRQYDYLYGCWTTAVRTDPQLDVDHKLYPLPEGVTEHYTKETVADVETWKIYTKYGLAWFTSYVNGLNKVPASSSSSLPDAKPAVNAFLERDVDMREHIWVPIGSTAPSKGYGTEIVFTDGGNYLGEFNGQGHIITGLQCRYVTGIEKYGLFGTVGDGGKVKNTFVDDYVFWTFKKGSESPQSYRIGGIASEASGNAVICGSEARGKILVPVTECITKDTYVGGLVGKVNSESGKSVLIHSSMAMPEIHGSAKYVGGLVGELGANNNLFNSFSNALFPDASYIDTCNNGDGTLNSYVYIGGLVGVNKGTVENCYSRLRGTEPKSNVTESPNYEKSIFGWLAGANNATINYCYGAKEKMDSPGVTDGGKYIKTGTDPSGHGTYTATQRYSGKYGFKHRDQQMYDKDGTTIDDNKYASNNYTVYLKYKTTNDTLIVGGLTNALNAWVNEKKEITDATSPYYQKGFADWMRTMASPINDDYPIPMLITKKTGEKFNSVGSKEGIFMLYEDNVNDMWAETGKNFQAVNETSGNAAMFLYDVQPLVNVSSDPESPVLKPCDVTISGNTNVPLYIHEDLGITQGDNNSLTARVGVTFDNSNRSPLPELGGQPYDWHMFSSALNKPSMGLRYHTDAEANEDESHYHIWKNYTQGGNYLANGIPSNIYNGQVPGHNRDYMDPPRTYFYQTDDNSKPKSYTENKSAIGYFPTNTPYGSWRAYNNAATIAAADGFPAGSFDFYMYGEAYYQHWINFKRRGDDSFFDHWRQDPIANGNHLNIPYPNETNMVNGRGYMMGVSQRSMLMADGTLNNGDVTYDATFTLDPSATVYDEFVRGTNLIGNPYQSYLDANEFFTANGAVGGIYYIFDADNGGYIAYPQDASLNPVGADQMIHPHQGFFVKVPTNTTITFNKDMRVAGKGTSDFRDERLNYPLVNLLCYDSRNLRDYTTVEINRPEVGGGAKMKRLRCGNAIIYSRYDQTDYQTVFTPVGVSEVPVRMEVFNDDVFTMRWSTLHGDFHYLHLIDNMTGSDIDMLRATEYHFEGKTTDYKSRFKLVFEVTGLEEEDDNEDDNGSSIVNFAFRMGDELIVNGEGYFELFDVQGRRLTAKHLAGAQSSVSLPNVAAGVYLLRLTGDKQVKTQKMVISY